MKLTDEQNAIVDFVRKGQGDLLIEALAGSGKTSTLIESLRVIPQRSVLICAFNKRIAEEIKTKIPRSKTHVFHVKTFHALGLSIINAHFQHVTVDDNATENLILQATQNRGVILPYKARRAAQKLLRTYKETESPAGAVRMAALESLPEPEDLLLVGHEYDLFGKLSDLQIVQVIETVMDAYQAMLKPDVVIESIDFCDMVWLPLAMGLKPPSRYQAIIVDEWQDISRPQYDLIQQLIAPGGRLIMAGDLRQCHPAGTLIQTSRGAVSIEDLDPRRDRIVPWVRKSQESHGERTFKVGRRPYIGPMLTLSATRKSVDVTPNHKLLARWANRESKACVTYLMFKEGLGYRVGWCQLFDKNGMFHLSTRWHLERADKLWVLKVHQDRGDASIYESIVAAQYGLFTATFRPIHANVHATPKAIRRTFAGVPMHEQTERAIRCLHDHARDETLPFLPRPGKNPRDHSGRPTYFLVHAANVLPGLMAVPLPSGVNQWTTIASVESRSFDGLVYSLEVDQDQTYSADGLIVHNSIYGWRGGSGDYVRSDAIDRGTKTLPLTTSFRCSQAVIKIAQELVPEIQAWDQANDGSVLNVGLRDVPRMMMGAISDEIHTFVLSRTNADLLDAALFLWREGVKFQLNAGQQMLEPLFELLNKFNLSSVEAFKKSLGTWYGVESARAEASNATAWRERLDEQFAMLTAVVAYVAPTGIEKLLRSILQAGTTGVLLSTVHKVKGLEADRVFLLKQTFQRHQTVPRVWADEDGGDAIQISNVPVQEELNIEYVAITRSRDHLIWVDLTQRSFDVRIDPGVESKARWYFFQNTRNELQVTSARPLASLSIEDVEALWIDLENEGIRLDRIGRLDESKAIVKYAIALKAHYEELRSQP